MFDCVRMRPSHPKCCNSSDFTARRPVAAFPRGVPCFCPILSQKNKNALPAFLLPEKFTTLMNFLTFQTEICLTNVLKFHELFTETLQRTTSRCVISKRNERRKPFISHRINKDSIIWEEVALVSGGGTFN